MDMQRRRFLKATAALAAAGAAPGVFAKGSRPFTVYCSSTLSSIPVAVAGYRGRLAKQTKLELKTWRSPDQLCTGVGKGNFKAVVCPTDSALSLYNNGHKLGMVSVLATGIMHVIGKMPVARPQDLAGKKVLMPFKKDMPDIMFRALLKQLNIDAAKVEISYAPSSVDAVGMFLTKPFDVAFLPEPMASAVLLRAFMMENIKAQRCFDFTKAWGEAFKTKPFIPYSGLFADAAFYKANKTRFEVFHQDLTEALEWTKSNRAVAASIGKTHLPAPPESIVEALPRSGLTATKASDVKKEIMQFYEILLRFEPKVLGGKLPGEDFFLM